MARRRLRSFTPSGTAGFFLELGISSRILTKRAGCLMSQFRLNMSSYGNSS